MTVYNSLGRPVRTLVDGELSAGAHRAAWDGGDEARGRPRPAGSTWCGFAPGPAQDEATFCC